MKLNWLKSDVAKGDSKNPVWLLKTLVAAWVLSLATSANANAQSMEEMCGFPLDNPHQVSSTNVDQFKASVCEQFSDDDWAVEDLHRVIDELSLRTNFDPNDSVFNNELYRIIIWLTDQEAWQFVAQYPYVADYYNVLSDALSQLQVAQANLVDAQANLADAQASLAEAKQNQEIARQIWINFKRLIQLTDELQANLS